ncbi:SGNH/GDSL hydrolase family protein [Luteibacter aegosomatissinici]|uniref:SGNH/GDSL hydrolase family protein n=1 Tax=Luteibacter aegosomatissinici TaxID=2911539 RepID=UPI001FF7410F|nr:SGNH/GDSL hydrolase family protein [Luteibacter aegosomatissinici]UPG93273.1 SGNH/GDSL hydrolase family protein [Luteibacter aegosomatissinici]
MLRDVMLAMALCAVTTASLATNTERQVLPEHPSADQKADIERRLNDWPQLERYARENEAYPAGKPGEKRVVFMGDSITDGWGRQVGEFFPGKGYINRGISGQTTPQMLVRFRADVIALKPAVVVILAGTNDIAGNTGPSSVQMIEDNLMSMAELARAHGIRVVIANLLPISNYHDATSSTRRPPADIKTLNAWIRDYTTREHLGYIDYFDAMLDKTGQLRADLSDDGLHPNAKGYKVMAPLAQKAIDAALVDTTS